jgi:paraquat-inducible protein A
MNTRPRACDIGVMGCHGCGLVCTTPSSSEHAARCLRCGALLHVRHPDSFSRAWALLWAAMIFYIPANLLPVMHTDMLGYSGGSTIVEGIIEFWTSGSYGIALVIFTASVAVPCAKFLIIGLLLVTARRRTPWARRERAQLCRLVEKVGYWSMLDVLVVAIVAGLVKFKALADIEPRLGILFFGGMVILTMLSAMQFDPRLTWDDGEA